MKASKALLLINLGTPDKPEKWEVYKYLTQFLNDRRVIDIPLLLQKILVNLIIIPFRLTNSTKLYQRLWAEKGSPLLIYLENLQSKLQKKVASEYDVFAAMRYGNPSLKKVLEKIKYENYDELVIFPLFPQYASSTTGSVYQKLVELTEKWEKIPHLRFISQYHNHPEFIKAFATQISGYNPLEYDHVVFSYHGLPNRHLTKTHPTEPVQNCTCDVAMPSHGKYCYRATTYETTRLLVRELGLPEGKYSVAFQSRLSKNWMTPFTDDLIVKLAKDGKKNVLITAPAFTADCLETLVELGYEYNKLFKENGGQNLTLVSSLNDSDVWVNAIEKMVKN